MIDRDDIERARQVIRGRLHRTPLLSCRTLGPHAFLKAELFQKTGSFKPRGMLNSIAALSAEEKARGIVTWSAGNAAQGAAFAAATEGIPCQVFMWATANPLKVAATRGYGAEVDLAATTIPRGARATARIRRGVGQDLRPSVRRSDPPGGSWNAGARGRRGSSGARDDRRPGRRRRAHRRSRVCRRLSRRRCRARARPVPDRRARGRRARPHRAQLHGRRPQRAVHRGRHAGGLPRARRRGRARERGGDRRRDALPLHAREARLRARRRGRSRRRCSRAKSSSRRTRPLVAVVSGGNADPKVVAGILASR